MKAEFDKAAALDDFNTWFEGSKVVGANGEPLVVFHATPHSFPISEFKPFSHFGSVAAANKIADDEKYFFWRKWDAGDCNLKTIPAFLSLKNPLKVKDFGSDIPFMIAGKLKQLAENDGDNFSELKTFLNCPLKLNRDKWVQNLVIIIKRLGYDGFYYNNHHEDSGSVSYIVFDASQVRPAIPLNGVLSKKSYYLSKDIMRPWPLAGLQ